MKSVVELNGSWSLKQIEPAEKVDPSRVAGDPAGWLAISEMPAQVHDVLLAHKALPEEILVGWCESAEWVGEYDWVYRCEFPCDMGAARYDLVFKGLDTVADAYLNGRHICYHDDLYVSERIDVTGLLGPRNVLVLHFHNILGYLQGLDYPEEWRETVQRCKLVRKPTHDFPPDVFAGSDYQGAYRYFSPIGVYGKVLLAGYGRKGCGFSEIRGDFCRAELDADLSGARVRVSLSGATTSPGVKIVLRLSDPDGAEVWERELEAAASGGEWSAEGQYAVESPEIWWPRGFGEHPLYGLRAELWSDGELQDQIDRQLGFRHVEMPMPLMFVINGKKVRLWGGSMDPFQGYTHCWRQDRMIRLMDMIENANMNTLRIWGQGIPYSDAFYEEADRRGVLIWQEFFFGFGGYPDSEPYIAKYMREARELILRLRHHASLLMWCGGNEMIMGSEFLNRDRHVYSVELVDRLYPELVGELDPGRYFHPSSPSLGEWANDPRSGDHHTYDCVWQYPHKLFPNFVSEHIRTAPPVMHSLKKIIRGELWPKGYDGKFTHGQDFPMPDSWMERSHHPVQGHIKTGPYWEFYDADNAYDHVYRFAASYAKEMRAGLERTRMGGPDASVPPEFRTKGHFSCKLNDTWPKVYCAVIDYFQEGFMPYYATLRAQQPVLVCFDIRDSIHLWLVNDSAGDVSGTVRFGLFDIEANKFALERELRATMGQGESGIVFDLDELKFFKKFYLPCATFDDDGGLWHSSSIDYCCVERHYRFPEARLSARIVENDIEIRTDSFARCVEITGSQGQDPFGWLFSDNYFDLLPGETKRVRILGRKQGGIALKPHYSRHSTTLFYRRRDGEGA